MAYILTFLIIFISYIAFRHWGLRQSVLVCSNNTNRTQTMAKLNLKAVLKKQSFCNLTSPVSPNFSQSTELKIIYQSHTKPHFALPCYSKRRTNCFAASFHAVTPVFGLVSSVFAFRMNRLVKRMSK